MPPGAAKRRCGAPRQPARLAGRRAIGVAAAVLLLLCSWSARVPAVADQPVISLAADPWCPYNCEPGSAQPGYVIELVRTIFADAGYRVEYLTMPWARALRAVEQGDVYGAIGASPAELPEAVFPTEPVGQFSPRFAVARSQEWRFQGFESLEGVRLGVINDYDYGTFNDSIESHRQRGGLLVLSGKDAGFRGLKMLLRGRLDALLDDANVISYRAKNLGVEEGISFAASPVTPLNIYIAFSPRHPQAEAYADLLSAGIGKMRRSGQLAQLLARYGLRDWK